MNTGGLGLWLETQRTRTRFWLRLLLLVLGLLTLLNIVIRPGAEPLVAPPKSPAAERASVAEPVAHGPASAHGAEAVSVPQGFLNALFLIDAPHFVFDAYPGFWQAFGLLCALAMAFVLKRMVAPLLRRPEDCYDRDD